MSFGQNWSQEKRLWTVFGINLLMVGALIVVGLLAHSLGVLAAGGDYIADAGAIAISLLALRISRHPHGHPKATTYAALVNVLFMLSVTIIVIYNSVHRLANHVPQIDGLPVFIVSAIGAIVMIFSAYLLANSKAKDLNMRAVLLDTTADAAFGAGVSIVGLIIFLTNRYYILDPIIALVIAFVILYHALGLFSEVVKELKS